MQKISSPCKTKYSAEIFLMCRYGGFTKPYKESGYGKQGTAQRTSAECRKADTGSQTAQGENAPKTEDPQTQEKADQKMYDRDASFGDAGDRYMERSRFAAGKGSLGRALGL